MVAHTVKGEADTAKKVAFFHGSTGKVRPIVQAEKFSLQFRCQWYPQFAL